MKIPLLILLLSLIVTSCQDPQDIKYDWTLYHLQVTTQGSKETKTQTTSIVRNKSELEMEVTFKDYYENYDYPYHITIAHLYSWTKYGTAK